MQWPTSGPTGPAQVGDSAPGPASTSKPFDSGLTTPDFVACLFMGLQPLGLVQGFYCGQVSAWSGYVGQPEVVYSCMHYPERHMNPGYVARAHGLDEAWGTAYSTALSRMMAEAAGLGAHGVVGVTAELGHPGSHESCEVHLYGTAVRVEGAPATQQPWSTHLAGHKLAKLVEIGFVPWSVAYVRCTTVLNEGCQHEYYDLQSWDTAYIPLRDLLDTARGQVLRDAQRLTQGASMYDVSLSVYEAEHSDGAHVVCTLVGSLVRKVRSTLPLSPPLVTVRLS